MTRDPSTSLAVTCLDRIESCILRLIAILVIRFKADFLEFLNRPFDSKINLYKKVVVIVQYGYRQCLSVSNVVTFVSLLILVAVLIISLVIIGFNIIMEIQLLTMKILILK